MSIRSYMTLLQPICVEELQDLLSRTGFCQSKTKQLVAGFRHGFDFGYRGPHKRKDTSPNIPITVGSEQEMWDKLMKEVKLGRHAGPFTHVPYVNFIQSPIGLVPKAGGQTHLIFSSLL